MQQVISGDLCQVGIQVDAETSKLTGIAGKQVAGAKGNFQDFGALDARQGVIQPAAPHREEFNQAVIERCKTRIKSIIPGGELPGVYGFR